MQTVELNLILIPEVANCQVTLTAQRGDNGLCHSIDNCEAYCCHCNSFFTLVFFQYNKLNKVLI